MNADIEIREWTTLKDKDTSGAAIFGGIVLIYMIIITIILCYCMIKNRKLIGNAFKN